MKVLSLVPSATEIVCALGSQESLCGVSCDCDYPDTVSSKPVVSAKVLPISSTTAPAAIDRMVRDQLHESDSIYTLDRALIQKLQPDVILAQDLCRVCAVPSGHVEEALDVIGCTAQVLSLDPHNLDEVLESILNVGSVLNVTDEAESFVRHQRSRIERVRRLLQGIAKKRVVALEWQDPPFSGGHWVPEMIDIAGGEDLLGTPGGRSRTLSWGEIAAVSPDVIVYMPCGYGLAEAATQLPELYEINEFRQSPAAVNGEVFVTDSSSYFSRSGPRLIDGVELLAGLLHPTHFPPPSPDRALHVRLRDGSPDASPV
jgi:iron complex transport system substrate-binding protein